MSVNDEGVRVKRFKHQSHAQALKDVHLPSALSQSKFDHDITDNESHFHEALIHWRQLNLAPAFIHFAQNVEPLSASMPLLLHNWREIIDIWVDALESSDQQGLCALLDLLQKMAHDLRTTLSPVYLDLLNRLLKFLSTSISAPALTALLATFSSLFKYLLVPSIDPELLKQTWSSVHSMLPKCPTEVQRAMAEVWGSVLRRFKPSAREQAVTLLVGNTTGVEDACAWMLVFACKSVSQTLHSSTVSTISPALAYYLSCPEPATLSILLGRVLTALIHHVKSADQFTGLGDLLITNFLNIIKISSTEQDQEQLCRMIEILCVATSVRQASRLSSKQILSLASEFSSVPMTETLQPTLLKFATSLLVAGDMAMWMGPGRNIIARSWEDVEFGIKLSGVLSDQGWGGWKMIGLPSVLRMTPQLLEKNPSRAIGLLATLHREKKLGDVDMVWKQRVETWIGSRLTEWERSEESVMELHDVLAFSGVLPSIPSFLTRIINVTLECPNPKENYETTYANSSWVLSACMQALAECNSTTWADGIDLASWTRKSVEKWGWSDNVLEGLVAVLQICSPKNEVATLGDLYPALRVSILSHSRPLRLNALRLLACKSVKASVGEQEVVKRCLQGEEVSLDIQGVRERLLRIGRVGQVVRDDDEISADLCVRWLVAQLKVNLRPLWSSAIEALASLSQRFGDVVWSLVFTELQTSSLNQDINPTPHWVEGVEGGQAEADIGNDHREEERAWRDPSAHKLRSAVAKWLHGDRTHFLRDQYPKDRLDQQSYILQLLAALNEFPSLAEKHNRDLVPHFISLAGAHVSTKMPRQKLSSWLSLFAKFSNPKVLHSTGTLHALYVSLLSHPDRSIQTVSLSCLLTYKSPHLVPHEDQLRALLDNARWREELTSLDLGLVEPIDRNELVDVIVRLLFGIMLERRGRTGGVDRRTAVLGTLAGCTEQELGLLVDLMLDPIQPDHKARRGEDFTIHTIPNGVSEKQQIGFLTLLGEVLKNMGPRLLPYWPALLATTIDLINQSQARIKAVTHSDEAEVEDDAQVDGEDELEEDMSSSKKTRSVRQLGLKRFADFFRCPISFDFTPFMEASFSSLISPRLVSLDTENTQAPSALLELFYSWTLQARHAMYLVDYDPQTLPKIYSCLTATNVKPAVISRIFDIVDRLMAFAETDCIVLEKVLKPHISLLLENLAVLVQRNKGVDWVSTPLGQRQIGILSEIAQYSTDSTQASTLLSLFSPMLRKPAQTVPEKRKVDLLKILSNLFSLIPDLVDRTTTVYIQTYDLLSQLFQRLRTSQARLALISAFHRLALIDTSLQQLSSMLESLNAYSSKRVDEPDFDRRLDAFETLNQNIYKSLSSQDWLPVLYNMLHFLQDPTELAMRNNASFALRHFIDLVHDVGGEFEVVFTRKLYPGLKNGLRSRVEMVRGEVLGVIAYAVAKCDNIKSLREMRVLLAGGDEEANFFNNIHHVQIHRRTRALRRLADQCDEGHMSSSTLAEILVPLATNYIAATTSVDHHLVNEAISTTGRMSKHLAWGAYFSLVQKYLKSTTEKDIADRVHVRALVAILDNFHFPMDDIVHESGELDQGNTGDDEEIDGNDPPPSLPKQNASDSGRIADAVNHRLLPNLLQYLEKRDANVEDYNRIPVAVGIVNIAKHLPASTREPQISKLLTVLCQILRSRSQETRDLTRDTLNRIADTLGPSYLPLILKEMRAALLRGPQLHVLAFVAHSLLVHITTGDRGTLFSNLDDCVNDVAFISAEVVFGEPAKEVRSEDFKTKMREVRSSSAKGMDSFAIMASRISPLKISGLLAPLRAIMQETESHKTMQQVEEALRRIANGLNANNHLVSTELLVLCHTLISQNARFLKQTRTQPKNLVNANVAVQTKRQVALEADHYANNSYRFIAFGLDLFNTALRRGRFDFRDAAIIARLEAMVVVIGNTLYSVNSPVLVLGLKSISAIVKCPLKSLAKSTPVFIRQILDIVKRTGATESEVVQASFKSLATILRDSSSAQVKENDLVYLLELLSPDLEEPSRQASVFSMLRAIVSRKFVVPEIYDLMDKVSEIMVTSQSPSVQELCRGVLLQFLLDYPQGKGRLRNQMTFLAKNLSYVYESGRRSVMELLNAIISKFEVGLVREYSDLVFVALVMVIVNDDSAKCREMAAELIKNLFTKLDDDHRRLIISHLHSWASQHSQPQLVRVSSQTYGFVIDVLHQDARPYIPDMLEDLNSTLERSAQHFSSIEQDTDMNIDVEWEVPYHSLIVISKILREFSNITTEFDKVSWPTIVSHLLFPHAWVRTASCRLLGVLFAAIPAAAPDSALSNTFPLSKVGMRDVADKLCLQLKSEHLDSALSLQIVKNLFYIGKCFHAATVPSEADTSANDGLDDDERTGDDTAHNPLPWLFSKLSYQVKSAHIARRNKSFIAGNWSHQPSSVLRWFAAMASHMDPVQLERFLSHMLIPVYRIVEDDTIRDPQMDELKALAVELQDLVQSKVGPTKFSHTYNRIRQGVLGVQRERRAARAIQATVNPEAAAKRKLQRNLLKKDSRKRKNKVFADRRGRVKRRRDD